MEQVSSILDFADGSIIERINYELQKVLENVVHPNTDEKPRKLVVEITITPVNGRRSVSLNTTVKKTLRPTSSVQTQMVFQTLNGEMKAYEVTGIPDGQQDIFGDVHEQKFIQTKLYKEEGQNENG